MFTTYEVLKDAFGPPAACWTNEVVTCKWVLRFNDDDDNVIHVIIYDSPDERPPTPPGRTPDQSSLWHICGVDDEPTMKAVLAALHRVAPDSGGFASMEYGSADASEDASEGGGGGAAAEE